MKHFLAFILLFWGLETFGQNVKVTRTIMPRDISDSTKRLFYLELDSLHMYSVGKIPKDTQRIQYLLYNSILTFWKHGQN